MCVYFKYLCFHLLFVQGAALLMMIELVKNVISRARVIVADFFFLFLERIVSSIGMFLSCNVYIYIYIYICVCVCL